MTPKKPKTRNLKVTEAQVANLRWMVKEEMWNFKDSPDSYKSMSELLTQIDTVLKEFD